jgi:hypothetical protein
MMRFMEAVLPDVWADLDDRDQVVLAPHESQSSCRPLKAQGEKRAVLDIRER